MSLLLLQSLLQSHRTETHFLYKNLVIAQVGATPFTFIFYLIIFKGMVVKKASDVVMSTTKLSLCTAYNHLSVLFYV